MLWGNMNCTFHRSNNLDGKKCNKKKITYSQPSIRKRTKNLTPIFFGKLASFICITMSLFSISPSALLEGLRHAVRQRRIVSASFFFFPLFRTCPPSGYGGFDFPYSIFLPQ